jgi:hypothetical protein
VFPLETRVRGSRVSGVLGLFLWKRGPSSDLYVGDGFFLSALRMINVWAYVKTGAIYVAAFGLLIFGLGFISWSFGSACPPTCPPVPPNPAVERLGATLIGPQEEGDEYGGPRHSIAETLSPIMTRACEGEAR